MGYVNVDTIYEEEGQEKVEIKNDYVSVEEVAVVEMVMKKSRFIAMAFHVESDDEVHPVLLPDYLQEDCRSHTFPSRSAAQKMYCSVDPVLEESLIYNKIKTTPEAQTRNSVC